MGTSRSVGLAPGVPVWRRLCGVDSSTADPARASLDGYQLRLPTFEGPLDVLLRLIERSQLAITDVSLVAVTDQFLDHLRGMETTAPETVAEFAAVGARLVLLKSRSILPRPPSVEGDDADHGDLARQLVAYRSVKEAAKQLADRDAAGTWAFARRADAVALPGATAPPRLAMHQPGSLARALRRRLTLVAPSAEPFPVRRVVTLREMVERVLDGLARRPVLPFTEVAAGCQARQEVLTGFLAVLVLVRRRVVQAEQTNLFGEITLRRAAPLDQSLADGSGDGGGDPEAAMPALLPPYPDLAVAGRPAG